MELHIVENVAGNYHMHLSLTGTNGGITLCGVRNVMHTCFRIGTWNSSADHIRMGYCAKCTAKAAELGHTVPAAKADTIVFGAT